MLSSVASLAVATQNPYTVKKAESLLFSISINNIINILLALTINNTRKFSSLH